MKINLKRKKDKSMKLLKYILTYIFSFLMIGAAMAQRVNSKVEEPTDFMHANGKIFVVMAVVIVIIVGLFLYLINLDRKIGKLEKGYSR